jgi:hypothetical protein
VGAAGGRTLLRAYLLGTTRAARRLRFARDRHWRCTRPARRAFLDSRRGETLASACTCGLPLARTGAELALSQLEEARAALDPLLLAPEEVEALALGSCWLARYWVSWQGGRPREHRTGLSSGKQGWEWRSGLFRASAASHDGAAGQQRALADRDPGGSQGLAAAFGIHLEVSEAAAERWREVAPPPSAMLDAARRAATAATRRGGRSGGGGGSGGGGSAASSSRGGVSRCETEGGASTTSGGDQQQQQQHQLAAWWIHQRRQQQQQDDRRRRQRSDGGGGGGAVRRPDGDGGARGLLLEEASAADAADVDLALRQLAELGVEAEVMGALAEQARARRAVVQLPQAVSPGADCRAPSPTAGRGMARVCGSKGSPC